MHCKTDKKSAHCLDGTGDFAGKEPKQHTWPQML